MTTFDIEPETLELEALGRKYVGLTHQARIEGLARRLRTSSLAVVSFHAFNSGKKLRIELECGSKLTLALFWPHQTPLRTIDQVEWNQRIGWQIDVTRVDGTTARLFAWRGRLEYGGRER